MKIRKRDRDAIGIVVVDLGTYDLHIHEDDFRSVTSQIISKLRASGLLHGVLVSALKRGVPSTWLYLAHDVHKRTPLATAVRDQLLAAFPFGHRVGPSGDPEPFGVGDVTNSAA